MKDRFYQAVVIGGSAGCTDVLGEILGMLSAVRGVPVLVVRHLHPEDDGAFARHLNHATRLVVVEPFDKQKIEPGSVYTAPSDYHMMVEKDASISLSVCDRVNWSRPSIDVLFESAARVWGDLLIAILLSGASCDGSQGVRFVKAMGGLVIVQDPTDAESSLMPQSALDAVPDSIVAGSSQIGSILARLLITNNALEAGGAGA